MKWLVQAILVLVDSLLNKLLVVCSMVSAFSCFLVHLFEKIQSVADKNMSDKGIFCNLLWLMEDFEA